MRLMSFAATTAQMYAGTKTVTRRIDRKVWWAKVLKSGTLVCAVEKSQGIPKGGKVKRIGVIEIVGVRRELLHKITDFDAECPTCEGDAFIEQIAGVDEDPRKDCPDCYRGSFNAECDREGFRNMPGADFVDLFCHINGCEPDVTITRIEFKHRPDLSVCCGEERLQLHDAELDVDFTACSECKRVQP